MTQKRYKTSLHIFRRDLRIYDNNALNAALTSSDQVIPCFIFDPRQIQKHSYQSSFGLKFLVESLQDLAKQIEKHDGKLFILYGNPVEVIADLQKKYEIDSVYFNMDYTPFSQKRDDSITSVCHDLNIDCHQYHDLMLNPPEVIEKKTGGWYTVFTPYFRTASILPVSKPEYPKHFSFFTDSFSSPLSNGFILPESVKEILDTYTLNKSFLLGGRENAIAMLKNLDQHQDYNDQRNFPALAKTTGLSAHNKFGTLSIREVYHAFVSTLGRDHGLVRQLYWRDFFTQISVHFSHIYGHAYRSYFDAIAWENNISKFKAWQEGKTGFPLVDAGMRQLNTTGYMHNRVRMVVASFLTKDLHIDWRWGERYFAQKLVDYDPAVNNGSWQWAASTGCDAQPYFRIFNPWLQQKRFDLDAVYIKRWIPELKHLTAKMIHKLAEFDYTSDYPRPIVDHKIASIQAKELFKEAKLISTI